MDKQKNNQRFYKLISTRKKYSIEQEHFAILLGIKMGTYSRKENGRIPFSHKEINKILWAVNKKATDAGHEPIAYEDIFLRPEDEIPIRSKEPIVIEPTLIEYLVIYRIWFKGLSAEEKYFMGKNVAVANFNVTFGEDEKPLLEYFDSIIYPSFTSNIKRHYRYMDDENTDIYSLIDVKIVDFGNENYVLTGKFVKETIVEIKGVIKDNQLIKWLIHLNPHLYNNVNIRRAYRHFSYYML